MTTKKTILSEKELNLIEDLIAKYGIITNFEQIFNEVKNKIGRQTLRNLISKLIKNGWLVRIKKGVYYIANLESKGTVNISTLTIAQVLLKDSYISFEAALQYYGMFDQLLRTISSVSLKKHKKVEIQGTNYKFIKTKRNSFYGWKEISLEGRLVRIATLEKTILDVLHFNRTIYAIDLILEKLKEHKNMFNWDLLNKFGQKQSISVQRILGFLLEKAGINANYIYDLIKNKKGCSYMTKDSKNFNARWRLYYDKYFN